ncbi:MAG: 3-methyl-2-oxobutanoate dehydrogenase subunit beta, partial [Bacteroidales bacterium]|nr:3-methyl-2-oxobutanoate dehydrogenase subunit beta [Bacteroidales bacterium]
GTVARICKTAIDMLEKQGVHVGMVRPITIWPFPKDAVRQAACAPNIKKVLTIEVSAGQMVEDVRLATGCSVHVEHFGRLGGMIPTPNEVLEALENQIIKGK